MDAAQFNAVVGEHVAVVLEMLADLPVLRRLEPGLETRQHVGKGQLIRRTGIVVAERQIGSDTRLPTQKEMPTSLACIWSRSVVSVSSAVNSAVSMICNHLSNCAQPRMLS
jgi:hypothetical protein